MGKKKKKGWNTLPTKAKPYTSFIYAQQRIISFKKKPFVSNKRENSRELCVDRGDEFQDAWEYVHKNHAIERERTKPSCDGHWGLCSGNRPAQRISTCPNPPLFSVSALRRFPWREVIFQMNRELLKLNLKNKPKNPKIKINQKMALRRITTRIDPHHHHHTNFFRFLFERALRVRARTNIKVNQCRPSRIVGGRDSTFFSASVNCDRNRPSYYDDRILNTRSPTPS